MTSRNLPPLALAASVAVWVGFLLAASGSSEGSRMYASSMTSGSTVGSVLGFLAGWEVMVVAMMLPSSLRFLALFRTVTSAHPHRGICRAAVGIGYGLAWAAAGWVMLVMSTAVYRVVGLDLWLQRHPGLFAGLVLTLVGGFQLTTVKRRCLGVCSSPQSFVMRHYRRGALAALDLGGRYGIVCVGCCWALMLLTVVLGAGSMYAMILLSAIMFAERALGWNARFTRAVGLACLASGIVMAISPGALPALAHGARMWSTMGSAQARNLMLWCHA